MLALPDGQVRMSLRTVKKLIQINLKFKIVAAISKYSKDYSKLQNIAIKKKHVTKLKILTII